jgi:FtsH-binding integral membrane protein
MVNSALYNRFVKGGKPHSGHAIYNLMGGKKGGALANEGSSFLKLLNEKKKFLIAVFANLIAQLGITYYFMMNYNGDDKKSFLFWGLFIIMMLIIFALALIPMPTWLKIILFSIFSTCSGIVLSFMKRTVDSNIIETAIVGTISIFGIMFLFGAFLIMFGINLGLQFAAFLFYALLLLIIVQVVVLFSGKSSMFVKTFSVIGLIIFSLYIIYDTNNILQREYYGDFVTASLDYYLDIINIFVDLLGLIDKGI